jgi:hypothetical protein
MLVATLVRFVVRVRDMEQEIEGVVTFSNLPRDHSVGPLIYAQVPPAGGSHYETWQNCGIYEAPISNELAVHSLEHGAVWIAYQSELPPERVEQLRRLVRAWRYVLLSPYKALPAPIVATAWGAQLQVEQATDPRLTQFLAKYVRGLQTAEPLASCDQGIGIPLEPLP